MKYLRFEQTLSEIGIANLHSIEYLLYSALDDCFLLHDVVDSSYKKIVIYFKDDKFWQCVVPLEVEQHTKKFNLFCVPDVVYRYVTDFNFTNKKQEEKYILVSDKNIKPLDFSLSVKADDILSIDCIEIKELFNHRIREIKW